MSQVQSLSVQLDVQLHDCVRGDGDPWLLAAEGHVPAVNLVAAARVAGYEADGSPYTDEAGALNTEWVRQTWLAPDGGALREDPHGSDPRAQPVTVIDAA